MIQQRIYAYGLDMRGIIKIAISTAITYLFVELLMIAAYFPMIYIVYRKQDVRRLRTHWIIVPLLVYNLFYLAMSSWNKAFDGMPWVIFIQNAIISLIWIEVLFRYIRVSRGVR